MTDPGSSHRVTPAQAVKKLGLPEAVLKGLVTSGYLTVKNGHLSSDELTALGSLRPGNSSLAPAIGYDELLEELGGRIEELSRRTLELFIQQVAEARSWTEPQRESFTAQARGRFDAILAVIDKDMIIEESIQSELEVVGANASKNDSSLLHILLVLRISRDVLVRMTLDLARKHGKGWDGVSRELISRLLPAIDRLGDAIARGYWTAQLEAVKENMERLDNVMESLPYGAYETDMDGVIRWANDALISILNLPASPVGRPLSDIFRTTDKSQNISALFSEVPTSQHLTLRVTIGGGQEISIDVDTMLRRSEESVVGYAGIVRESSSVGLAEVDLSGLQSQITEVKSGLKALAEAGKFLSTKSNQLAPEHLAKAGQSIEQQAARLFALIDTLEHVRD